MTRNAPLGNLLGNGKAGSRHNGPAAILLIALSLLYPAAVYFGRAAVPPLAFATLALLLIAVRIAMLDAPAAREWRGPLIVSALALVVLAALDSTLAAKGYPIVMSAAFAAVFAMSLARPPSLVERFARVRHPDLPPEGQAYCRIVTMVWTGWLALNALIALLLAVFGSDAAWALWTGVIAYVIMGLLFAGEWIVRRGVVGQKATTTQKATA